MDINDNDSLKKLEKVVRHYNICNIKDIEDNSVDFVCNYLIACRNDAKLEIIRKRLYKETDGRLKLEIDNNHQTNRAHERTTEEQTEKLIGILKTSLSLKLIDKMKERTSAILNERQYIDWKDFVWLIEKAFDEDNQINSEYKQFKDVINNNFECLYELFEEIEDTGLKNPEYIFEQIIDESLKNNRQKIAILIDQFYRNELKLNFLVFDLSNIKSNTKSFKSHHLIKITEEGTKFHLVKEKRLFDITEFIGNKYKKLKRDIDFLKLEEETSKAATQRLEDLRKKVATSYCSLSTSLIKALDYYLNSTCSLCEKPFSSSTEHKTICKDCNELADTILKVKNKCKSENEEVQKTSIFRSIKNLTGREKYLTKILISSRKIEDFEDNSSIIRDLSKSLYGITLRG